MCGYIWRTVVVEVLLVVGLTGAGAMAPVEAGDDARRPLSCSLKTKYLEPDTRLDVLYYHLHESHPYRPARSRYVSPDYDAWLAGQTPDSFSRIVKMEPSEYRSTRPFRGVVTLGGRQFAFVFDTEGDSPLDYGRLYFDLNCNGDLTDDGMIQATERRDDDATHVVSHVCSFPRVHVTLEVDGTKMDDAFYIRSGARGPNEEKIRSVWASFSSALYREGELTLAGERRRVVLLDYNCNGRFDDAFSPYVSEYYGTAHANICDRLLIESKPHGPQSNRGFELEERYVSKLVEIDGRYYRPEISTTGDILTLEPLSLPIGHVTNPNEHFIALVHNDGKILKIRGGKSERLPLPEGQWNLLSYTIRTEGERPSRIEGQATTDCKPVSVRRGQTTVFPFGPPLKPVAKVMHLIRQNEAGLMLFLYGTAGESCAPISAQGRWIKPELTISAPAGQAVAQDKFGYGCSNHLFYQWKLPSELADEYHVRVRVNADPFDVDDTGYSVIPRSDLVRKKGKMQ